MCGCVTQKLVRRVYMNRSVADFEKLCNRLPDCSASELCILQPVLYMHLDPDRIPAKSTPAAATDIELVYRSLLVIVATLGYIDGSGIGSAGSEKQYLISAWNRVAPWLIFFHDQFIMCRANYRPVDKMAAIRVVASLLLHVVIVSGKRGGTTLLTTPALYRPIAELWLLALKTKDKYVVCLSSSPGPAQITSFRVFGSLLVSSCIQDESFVTILLEVSGGIDAVTSAALKYVKSLRSMAKARIASDNFKLELLVLVFSHCVRIIATTSTLDAAIREAYVLRQSVKEIFGALRVLQSLSLGKESMAQALAPSFTYLDFLLKHADDPASALHQALCARAFETMVHISPSGPLEVPKLVETDPRRINEAFFRILFKYSLDDKILSYVCKHVDAWSNNLGPTVRQEKYLLDIWSSVEQTLRVYGTLRFKAETIWWPSPSEKGWVLQCHCGGTAEDIRFRQCAGCQVVRYCSKRCQRDSWHSHHRLSCNFLKAAVGSSTPHRMKRSLRLLAALEVTHKKRKWDNILRLVAAAQCEYPEDQKRLVVELALDKHEESVRPLRDYLFLFNGLSENEVVDRLSSWPDHRGQLQGLQGPFLCSVITIHDRYWSRQILFSPCMALDMEIYGDSAANTQP
ncbi:uncharacterized protein HD556DRAFT_1360590 [Suillus plorans]|uniref:MYND-type domain-containing protein n=1 Tax=Suillus plorans TaxID=116603 RepID=A0A9P7DJU3_9AGAM|nr:uncharacterized protein HD556DRAFT_1360590 [Suillus plorans]KAG1796326.1 hypothetical protein HD556DRAFT_1360590 [Suillus plorans]